ncbi:lactonase family protein [Carnobacterium mobile]|uniref:lactonase family protein n=1 Tax=Carnobacterium mobile TaxID=2750 RepID=UPI00186924DD|nr:lactonase family protein [Carnobacterium mobile]
MKENILLGTYTKRESKGVYQIQLDTEKKELADLSFVVEADSPTYLALSDDQTVLYAISKENGAGALVSFKKNVKNDITKVDAVSAEGAPPCYVSFDKERSFVYTANYHKGEVAVLKTDAEGHLALLDTVKHTGSSVHENQQSAHAHYMDLTPDNRFVVACDLGTDAVYTYSVDETGKLTEVSRYNAAPGTGPRHLVFHPNGTTAYLFGELSSEVLVLDYEPKTGTFTHLQTISTIPAEHTRFNGGAAIRISDDGRFIYASNRGHDSIAVFSVSDKDQTLELVEIVPSEGKIPRDFAIDPSGKFIVAAHQDSDNLTLFERDTASGKLTLIQKDVYAPECVCVYFK